ncbi:zinc finger, AN1-type domain [Actinomortierella ambigua]|nr:zinc finger, AN1-type domain [Actinomortierella ambigua]
MLEFLPYTCQFCKQLFCEDHWKLENHDCPNKDDAARQDKRVPTCPLCEKPVPIQKGEDPNVRMEQHIAAGCPEPSTTASKPIYTNACNVRGCKNKSAIPIVCGQCHQNFCLKHRYENEHACKGKAAAPPRQAAAAAAQARAAAGASKIHNPFKHHPPQQQQQQRQQQSTSSSSSHRPQTGSSSRHRSGKDKEKCILS